MHSLNARVIAAELLAERLDTASRARRYARRRRRFSREERRDAPTPLRLRLVGR